MGQVLLIDDDIDLVEMYQLSLSQRGHAVKTAQSAREARESLDAAKPDAVVLDVMMEAKDTGFDLCREINRRFPDVPIIMLTGIHAAVDRSVRFEPDETWLPAAKFLDKPVDPAALADEIDAILKRS